MVITNDNFYAAKIYLLRSGAKIRLTLVEAFTTKLFPLKLKFPQYEADGRFQFYIQLEISGHGLILEPVHRIDNRVFHLTVTPELKHSYVI